MPVAVPGGWEGLELGADGEARVVLHDRPVHHGHQMLPVAVPVAVAYSFAQEDDKLIISAMAVRV